MCYVSVNQPMFGTQDVQSFEEKNVKIFLRLFSISDNQKLISNNHDIKFFIGDFKLLKFFTLLTSLPISLLFKGKKKTQIHLYSFLFGLIKLYYYSTFIPHNRINLKGYEHNNTCLILSSSCCPNRTMQIYPLSSPKAISDGSYNSDHYLKVIFG